jgi:hypothetical protein
MAGMSTTGRTAARMRMEALLDGEGGRARDVTADGLESPCDLANAGDETGYSHADGVGVR